MELRHLRYFVTLAEELHFSRAAEQLRIVQPALSKQIKRLEDELGVRLLHRTKRKVELTEAGELFLDEARQILKQADEAAEIAQRASRGEIGKLKVGFVGPATLDVLPKAIKVIKERYPKLHLRLRELTTSEQVEALSNGSIKVGLVRELKDYDANILNVRPILRESLVVALPEDHHLVALSKVPLEALADEPYILLCHRLEPGLREKYLGACRNCGFSPRVVQDATHVDTMLGLVAEGIGLSLAPASLKKIQRDQVVYRELQSPSPEIEMAVAWRQDDSSQILNTFLRILEEVAPTPLD